MKPVGPALVVALFVAGCAQNAPSPDMAADRIDTAGISECRAAGSAMSGPISAICTAGDGLVELELRRCPASVPVAGSYVAIDRISDKTCAIRMDDDRVVFAEYEPG